jgi:effector-binding domain-containing protein
VEAVLVREVESLPTAVVRATTTWRAFPALWGELLGEVWACLRAGGVSRGCPNVMLYLDDTPRVEVGVWLRVPCELTGRVVHSWLPGGRVATTVHRGPFQDVGDAHRAVVDWCDANGERRTGVRWEIYGPHRDDPADLTTEVFWQLEPSDGAVRPNELAGGPA